MVKPKTPAKPVTEEDVEAAVEVLRGYRFRSKGVRVTHKAAAAANRSIGTYFRQLEAERRERAKRLGLRGDPRTYLRKLLKEGGA